MGFVLAPGRSRSPASARAADSTIAVLGIEAADGAPESVAVALTDALRQRASAERGTRLVPGKDLIEVKLIFSCPDEAPSLHGRRRQVAGRLQADLRQREEIGWATATSSP